MRRKISAFCHCAFALVVLAAFAAPAQAGVGQPSPWQMDFQQAVTPVQEAIHNFHIFITIVSFLIAAFVLVLLAIIILRFN